MIDKDLNKKLKCVNRNGQSVSTLPFVEVVTIIADYYKNKKILLTQRYK